MNSMETLTAFFGWCTVVGIGVYLIIVIGFFAFRKAAARINARSFGISEEDVMRASFAYLGGFKLAITVLFLVPYLALKIMA